MLIKFNILHSIFNSSIFFFFLFHTKHKLLTFEEAKKYMLCNHYQHPAMKAYMDALIQTWKIP